MSSSPPDGRRTQLTTTPRDMHLEPILESHPSSSSSSADDGSQTVLIPLVNRAAALCRVTQPSAPPLSDLVPDCCHLANPENNAVAMEYHVCHLPINGRSDSNSPILLIGCHRTSRETHARGEADDHRPFRRTSANHEIYMAPIHPPTYEEAIRRTTE